MIEEKVSFDYISLEDWLRIHYPKILKDYEEIKETENAVIQE